MSKFKRFLSSFLALTMVLGMFSMLGGVFAVDASAATLTPYTTHIKTYAELEAEYPDGFLYVAAEFLEADGTPTDHIIAPGDTLTVRLYVKSSFYLFGGRFDLLLDRNVFDIMNGEASGWLAKGEDLVEGKVYPTNGYKVVFSKSPLSEIHPEEAELSTILSSASSETLLSPVVST